MFTIIGGDGKEYGPVSAEQVKTWLASGRANLSTKAKAVGSDEWRSLGEFPEFGVAGGPPALPMKGPVTLIPQTDLASRGVRLGARCIDWALAIVSITPGMVLLGGTLVKWAMEVSQGRQPNFSNTAGATTAIGLLVLCVGWLGMIVVQILLLSIRGQSIGKCLTGIRIVSVEDGTKAGFLRAWLLREFVITVIAFVLTLLPFLGILLRPAFHLTDWCMIFRDDQRCLHDLIAGTQVVRVQRMPKPSTSADAVI